MKGGTTSCGCNRGAAITAAKTKHGMMGTPEYVAWRGMWQRCTNPNHPKYPTYKDRTPPEEWKDFTVFLSHIGLKPSPELSVDRIDNEKPYGPGNVRWATVKEQAYNRSTNRVLTYNGKTQTITEWCAELKFSKGALHGRLNRGWSAERALSTPLSANH